MYFCISKKTKGSSMKHKLFKNSEIFSISLIIFAIISRFIPHPPNFTPITSIALFSGFAFNNKLKPFLIPLLSMLISDAFIGFHSTMWAVYLSFFIIVVFGFVLRKNFNFYKLFFVTTLSSFLFYLITNFAVWLTSGMYPLTFAGLLQCYTLGLPFYKTTSLGMFGYAFLGDLFYSYLLFGAYKFAEVKIFNLQNENRNQ